MPPRGFGTADTIPAHGFSNFPSREETGGSGTASRSSSSAVRRPTAAIELRETLRNRHGTSFLPLDIVRGIAERAHLISGVGVRSGGQHLYQVAAHSADHAGSTSEWTFSTMAAGVYRIELEVPARLRLIKWRAKNVLKTIEGAVFASPFRRTERLARRLLPLVLVLGATVACSLVSQEGGQGKNLALGPMPELSKPKSAPKKEAINPDAPWHYVMPVDYGVRSDESGQGQFRAPRFHGEHNGLDLIAPIGTPVFSPCEGEAMSGVSRSFGRWVHVICPVPEQFAKKGQPHPWASFFYAHLETADLPHNEWTSVQGGQSVGKVGKTGNAESPTVKPHLHLELIVQRNKRAAMDERHLGSDQSSVPAADHFAEALTTECMDPHGFSPKSQLLRRARRLDPFVALTCLSRQKPDFIKAPSPLSDSSLAWTSFYVAKNFNVNLGVENSRIARN